MIRSIIQKIKDFSARLQQMEDEHFILNTLNHMRMKDPQNALLDPKYLPPIEILDGKLNEAGQMVVANVLAENLKKRAESQGVDAKISFGVYLEKAKKVVQELSLQDLKKLGLLSWPSGNSPLLPVDYFKPGSSIHIVDD